MDDISLVIHNVKSEKESGNLGIQVKLKEYKKGLHGL